MSEYEIGRDFQELRSRLERLEGCGDQAISKERGVGVVATHEASAGVERHKPPLTWKLEKQSYLPPFIHSIFGLPLELQFDIAPESKTWTCHPEPLILYINWNIPFLPPDEFYRLQNQTFSITKFTNPNSGITTCQAIYAAKLVASGKAKSQYIGGGRGAAGGYYSSVFNLSLKNAQGGTLILLESPRYSIFCSDNYSFVQSWDFNPGLYDLVAGATWEVNGAQAVDRC